MARGLVTRTALGVTRLLIVGAAINIGVAWACVLWSPLEFRHPSGSIWPVPVPASWPSTFDSGLACEGAGVSGGQWGAKRDLTEFRAVGWAAGWPLRSLGFRLLREEERAGPDEWVYKARGAHRSRIPIRSPRWLQRDDLPSREHLPTEPLAAGFIANSAFYAGAVFAASWALRRVRARVFMLSRINPQPVARTAPVRLARWARGALWVTPIVVALDVASCAWMFTWGALGMSGEVWKGNISFRRDSPGMRVQSTGLYRAGAGFEPGGLFSTTLVLPAGAYLAVTVPLWTLAVPSLVVAGVGIARARRRSARGWCTSCGYDVTGLADGACPECGAVFRRLVVAQTAAPHSGQMGAADNPARS